MYQNVQGYFGYQKRNRQYVPLIWLTAEFQVLKQFLVGCCNVNEETASKDACKIELDIIYAN